MTYLSYNALYPRTEASRSNSTPNFIIFVTVIPLTDVPSADSKFIGPLDAENNTQASESKENARNRCSRCFNEERMEVLHLIVCQIASILQFGTV